MKTLVGIILALVMLSGDGRAQGKGFGIGVVLGEPNGLSAKSWISERGAIDAGLAWSFRRKGYLHLHADYLWHFDDLIRTRHRLFPYIGTGARFGGRSGASIFGIRLVGGLTWWPDGVPLDVFLEVAPVLDLIPATEMTANGGIGVRYFFP